MFDYAATTAAATAANVDKLNAQVRDAELIADRADVLLDAFSKANKQMNHARRNMNRVARELNALIGATDDPAETAYLTSVAAKTAGNLTPSDDFFALRNGIAKVVCEMRDKLEAAKAAAEGKTLEERLVEQGGEFPIHHYDSDECEVYELRDVASPGRTNG